MPMPMAAVMDDAEMAAGGGGAAKDLGVTIEAQFEVGEYQVVILSAKESTGLDTWLRQEKYNIPEGAQPLLDPYVQGGSKFFVAKVDSKKIKFNEQGQAMLSPLRFHYDAQDFSLPVRLGLINAQGAQDLLVHILARGVRYETANYDNVAIPTNLEVKNEVRERFGQFYASLFDHTLANSPNSVITEYSWAAGSCDPCPEPALTLEELVTLGVDVLPTYEAAFGSQRVPSDYQWSVPNEFRAHPTPRALQRQLARRGPRVPGRTGDRRRPRVFSKTTASSSAARSKNPAGTTTSRLATSSATSGPGRSNATTRSGGSGAGHPSKAAARARARPRSLRIWPSSSVARCSVIS